MDCTNLIAVAESQAFVVGIKRSNEFLKVPECLAKLDVRVVGVQKNAEDCLYGTGVVDDLLGKIISPIDCLRLHYQRAHRL